MSEYKKRNAEQMARCPVFIYVANVSSWGYIRRGVRRVCPPGLTKEGTLCHNQNSSGASTVTPLHWSTATASGGVLNGTTLHSEKWATDPTGTGGGVGA